MKQRLRSRIFALFLLLLLMGLLSLSGTYVPNQSPEPSATVYVSAEETVTEDPPAVEHPLW